MAGLRVLAVLLTLAFVKVQGFVPRWSGPQRPWSLAKVTAQSATTAKTVGLKASSLDVGITNLSGNSTELSGLNDDSLPESMLVLPRHSSEEVNKILKETEHLIRNMHRHSKKIEPKKKLKGPKAREDGGPHDAIFANTYVDLGKVDTVGFDYDYTLVTYTDELLELIYDMALKRLVHDRNYPLEMLDAGLAFDPFFSIRGRCAKCSCSMIFDKTDDSFRYRACGRQGDGLDLSPFVYAQSCRRLGGKGESSDITNLQGISRQTSLKPKRTQVAT